MRRKRKFDEEAKKITKDGLVRAKKVLKYISPYKAYFILGLVLIVIGNSIFMLIPGVCGELVNVATGKAEYDFNLNQLGIFLGILVLCQAFISFIRTISLAIVSEKAMADMRKDLYNRLMTQPMYYYESNRVGEISSRITADVEQLQSTFAITLPEFLRQIVTLVIGISILAYLTPQLSLIMLMTFPVVVIAAMVFGRYIRKLSSKRQAALAETNTVVEETLQNFTIVKSFTNEWLESKRYGKHVKEIVRISLNFAKVKGLFFAFIISLLFGTILFILWKGSVMVQAGTMEAGYLLSFVIYTAVIGGAIAGLGNLYTQIASAIGATDRVLDIMEKDGELAIRNIHGDNYPSIEGKIELKDIEFNYPSRKDVDVLKGINISVPVGGKIALVGQSGSGKSTIAQLLMNFYEIDKGQILIDGKSMDEYNLTELRRQIGVVPQEVLLFGGTIRENISYGDPNASDEKIENAAKKSNSWEFISSFPDGLDTVIGERGIKLSGGQRQRIAIARAILKDPKILILDEATSSLDAESEKIVQEALDILMEGRTSVIIAHRLATIKSVDCIYVLDEGKIVESGRHEELIRTADGIYQNLANLQFASAN